jgi:hypothetical protein
MTDGEWLEFEEVGQGYEYTERGTVWMDYDTGMEWKSPGDYYLAKELGDLDHEGDDEDDDEGDED